MRWWLRLSRFDYIPPSTVLRRIQAKDRSRLIAVIEGDRGEGLLSANSGRSRTAAFRLPDWALKDAALIRAEVRTSELGRTGELPSFALELQASNEADQDRSEAIQSKRPSSQPKFPMSTLERERASCIGRRHSNNLLRYTISLVCRNGVPTSEHFDHKTVQLIAKRVCCSNRTPKFVIVDHVLE